MYTTILVPLDGSNFGERALPMAVSIARRSGAALHLAHVSGPYVPQLPDSTHPLFNITLEKDLQEDMLGYLEGLRARIGGLLSSPIHCEVLQGIVGQALERYVDENDVDLVVMSTHGRGGMNRMWLGSVAEDVIRHGRTPVLLVRPDEDTPGNLDEDIPVQRILVPLQTSEFSENIVPHADQLAEVFGASVQLLEVVVPVELPVRAISAPMTNVDQADLTTRQDSAREFLAGVETRLRGSGRQVESLVSTAPHVAHAIVKAADENDAGIIAMATHARVGIGRMLLGSVADKVVRSATKPVMLFRPGQL